jgi:hypothetical protein
VGQFVKALFHHMLELLKILMPLAHIPKIHPGTHEVTCSITAWLFLPYVAINYISSILTYQNFSLVSRKYNLTQPICFMVIDIQPSLCLDELSSVSTQVREGEPSN